jgi:hypothetical protein
MGGTETDALATSTAIEAFSVWQLAASVLLLEAVASMFN